MKEKNRNMIYFVVVVVVIYIHRMFQKVSSNSQEVKEELEWNK